MHYQLDQLSIVLSFFSLAVRSDPFRRRLGHVEISRRRDSTERPEDSFARRFEVGLKTRCLLSRAKRARHVRNGSPAVLTGSSEKGRGFRLFTQRRLYDGFRRALEVSKYIYVEATFIDQAPDTQQTARSGKRKQKIEKKKNETEWTACSTFHL